MLKWLDQGRRYGIGQVGLILAWLCAVALVLAALASLIQSQRLQNLLDRNHAVSSARAALEAVLVDGGAAELQSVVRGLVAQSGLGFKFLAVRAPGGLVVAQAGAYDGLRVPLVSAYYSDQLRSLLYSVSSDPGQIAITRNERTLATVEFGLSDPVRQQVHDAAVSRLRWQGIVGLILGLPLLAILSWALRRGGETPAPQWVQRMAPNSAASVPKPSAPVAGDAFQSRAGAALSNLQHGVIVVDREVRVRYLNEAAEALTGWNRADAAGRLVYSVFHPLGENEEPLVTPAEAALRQNSEVPARECRLRARNGVLRVIEVMAAVLHDADGVPEGAVMYFHDAGGRRQAVDELRRQSRLSRGVIDHLVEGVLTTDPAGVIRFANARALRMFGYAAQDLVGATVTKLMPVPFLNSPEVRITDYIASESRKRLPKVVGWRKDATTFPIELIVEPMLLAADGSEAHADESRVEGLVVVIRDITDRLRSENLQLRLGRLLDNAAEEVYIFEAQSLALLEVNRGARNNLGYRPEQLARMTPLSLAPGLEAEAFRNHLNRLRDGEQDHLVYRTTHQRADGSTYPVEVRLSYSREEEPPVFMAIAEDITERQAAEIRMQHLAHEDALTGLPNRPVLHDRLGQALLAALRTRRMVAIGCIDLDHFKAINDEHGHSIGDQLLRAVAERLRAQVRNSDTVGRVADDQFVVVAPGIRDAEDAEHLAVKLTDAFRQPFSVAGETLMVTASVGLALYPLDDSQADALLHHAEEAMQQVKRSGRAGYHLYHPTLDPDSRRRITLERDVRTALALEQIQARFEPVLRASDQAIVLLRMQFFWEHPEEGTIDGPRVSELARNAGILDELTLWQCRMACQFCAQMVEAGQAEIAICLPVSSWQLASGEFCDHLLGLLHRYAVPGRRLILALSEHGLADIARQPPQELPRLRTAGIRLAAQGFGQSYASLGRLGGLSLDLLWLSPGCISDLARGGDATLARAVIATAGSLKIPVVAPEVSDAPQAEMLRQLGCALISGPEAAPVETATAVLTRMRAQTVDPI